MSYVEKAFFHFLKQMLVGGFKALFGRRYVWYTAIALGSICVSTVYFGAREFGSGVKDTPFIYYAELGIAFALVIGGVLFSRLEPIMQIPLLIIVAGASAALFQVIEVVPISSYFAILSLAIWLSVTVIASFTFSRNLLGSKAAGSIMFLGKPQDEGGIIFGGFLNILFIADLLSGIYLTIVAFLDDDSIGIVVGLAIAVGSFVVIAATVLGSPKDDVFFSILGFFYAMASFRILAYAYQVNAGKGAALSPPDLLIAAFFLLYGVSGYGKKIAKSEEAMRAQEEEKDKASGKAKKKKKKHSKKVEDDDEDGGVVWIESLKMRIGDRGGIMIILGLVMGYHVSQLEAFTAGTEVIEDVTTFGLFSRVRATSEISIILVALVLFVFLAMYYLSPTFKAYASPDILRFDFLPPFEVMLLLINRISSGEISAKSLSGKFAWAAFKGGAKGLVSRGRSAKSGAAESSQKAFEDLIASLAEETEE